MEKHQDMQIELHMVFSDLEKAYGQGSMAADGKFAGFICSQ